EVRCDGAVGAGVGGGGFGLAAAAVAAQVGNDDGVRGRELDGDVPPHQVRLREAVQEHDRGTGAPDGGMDGHAVVTAKLVVAKTWDGHGHDDSSVVAAGEDPGVLDRW